MGICGEALLCINQRLQLGAEHVGCFKDEIRKMVMDRDHVERSVTIVGNGCWIMVIIGVIVLKHINKWRPITRNKVCNDCTLYFLPHKNASEKHFEEVEDLPRERG